MAKAIAAFLEQRGDGTVLVRVDLGRNALRIACQPGTFFDRHHSSVGRSDGMRHCGHRRTVGGRGVVGWMRIAARSALTGYAVRRVVLPRMPASDCSTTAGTSGKPHCSVDMRHRRDSPVRWFGLFACIVIMAACARQPDADAIRAAIADDGATRRKRSTAPVCSRGSLTISPATMARSIAPQLANLLHAQLLAHRAIGVSLGAIDDRTVAATARPRASMRR